MTRHTKIHSIRTTGYRLWCGRTLYSGRYDCSTPDRPPTCKQCLAAKKKAAAHRATLEAIAAAKEE